MDTAAASFAQSVGAQYGFNALLVLVLLFFMWRLGLAFVGALDRLGERLESNTAALNTVGEAVRTQTRAIDELKKAVGA